MIQLIRLVPDQDALGKLRLKPLVVSHCRHLVLSTDEETSGHIELINWNCRWLDLAVLIHVLDGTEVVAQPLVDIFHALHVIDQVLIAVARWVVFEKHVPPFHVINIVIST